MQGVEAEIFFPDGQLIGVSKYQHTEPLTAVSKFQDALIELVSALTHKGFIGNAKADELTNDGTTSSPMKSSPMNVFNLHWAISITYLKNL